MRQGGRQPQANLKAERRRLNLGRRARPRRDGRKVSTRAPATTRCPPCAGWSARHRLVPHDPNVTLALASACLAHDPARAASLFQDVPDQHDVRQAWLGLASARLRLAGPDEAAEPLAAALSRHAFSPDIADLAETIGCRSGSPGWCALRPDGGLEIHVSPATAPASHRKRRGHIIGNAGDGSGQATRERHHPDRNHPVSSPYVMARLVRATCRGTCRNRRSGQAEPWRDGGPLADLQPG